MDAQYLPLYVDFLGSLDLDHTVEQPAVLAALAEKYSDEDLAPVLDFVREEGGQVLQDWLNARGG